MARRTSEKDKKYRNLAKLFMEKQDTFTKGFLDELFRRIKESEQNKTPSYFDLKIQGWLGEGKLFSIDFVFPSYLTAVANRAVVDRHDKNVEMEEWDANRDGETEDPSYGLFPISVDSKKSFMTDGYRNIFIGGVKMVFSIKHSGMGNNHRVKLQGLKKDEAAVIKLAEEIQSDIVRNNYFKGQCIVYRPAEPEFMVRPSVKLDDIILDEKLKTAINQNTVYYIQNRDAIRGLGLPTRRGVLFSGPPGNGKTLYCKALSGVAQGMTVMWVTGNSITEKDDINDIFEMAKSLAPTLIIMEDIDTIGTNRDYDGQPTNLLLAELLTQLDGVSSLGDVFLLATTNYPDRVDDALKDRPNRFDRHFRIPRPSTADLELLMERYLKEQNVTFRKDTIQDFAKQMEGRSAVFVQDVVHTARINAFREKANAIGISHVQAAIDEIKLAATGKADVMVA